MNIRNQLYSVLQLNIHFHFLNLHRYEAGRAVFKCKFCSALNNKTGTQYIWICEFTIYTHSTKHHNSGGVLLVPPWTRKFPNYRHRELRKIMMVSSHCAFVLLLDKFRSELTVPSKQHYIVVSFFLLLYVPWLSAL